MGNGLLLHHGERARSSAAARPQLIASSSTGAWPAAGDGIGHHLEQMDDGGELVGVEADRGAGVPAVFRLRVPSEIVYQSTDARCRATVRCRWKPPAS